MKNKKGITIIALIVVIVIMLILSAVTIETARENQLFAKAKTSVKNYDEAQIIEQLKIYRQANLVQEYSNEKPKTIVDFFKENTNYKIVDENGNEVPLNEEALLGTQYDNYHIKAGTKVTTLTIIKAKQIIIGTVNNETKAEIKKLKYPDNLASMTQEEIVKFNRQIDPECPEFTADELVLKMNKPAIFAYTIRGSILDSEYELADGVDPNKILVDFGDGTHTSLESFASSKYFGTHKYTDGKNIHYVKLKKVDYNVEDTAEKFKDEDAELYDLQDGIETSASYLEGFEKIINFGEIGFKHIDGIAPAYLSRATSILSGNEILPIPNKNSFVKAEMMMDTFRNLKIETVPENLLWNAKKLKSVSGLFYGCTNLKEIPDKLFEENKKLTYVDYCFDKCINIESAVPKLWDKAEYSLISKFENTFSECTKAKNYNEIPSGWK